MTDPLTLNVKEAAHLLGLGRTAFYEYRRKVGLKPVPELSTPARPRYLRSDVVRLTGGGGAASTDAAAREAEFIRQWAHLPEVPWHLFKP